MLSKEILQILIEKSPPLTNFSYFNVYSTNEDFEKKISDIKIIINKKKCPFEELSKILNEDDPYILDCFNQSSINKDLLLQNINKLYNTNKNEPIELINMINIIQKKNMTYNNLNWYNEINSFMKEYQKTQNPNDELPFLTAIYIDDIKNGIVFINATTTETKEINFIKEKNYQNLIKYIKYIKENINKWNIDTDVAAAAAAENQKKIDAAAAEKYKKCINLLKTSKKSLFPKLREKIIGLLEKINTTDEWEVKKIQMLEPISDDLEPSKLPQLKGMIKLTLDEDTDKFRSHLLISKDCYKELYTLLINKIKETPKTFDFIFKTDMNDEKLYFFPINENAEKQYDIYNHISQLICLIKYLDLMDKIILGLKPNKKIKKIKKHLNKICDDFLIKYPDYPKYTCYNTDFKEKIKTVKKNYKIKTVKKIMK